MVLKLTTGVPYSVLLGQNLCTTYSYLKSHCKLFVGLWHHTRTDPSPTRKITTMCTITNFYHLFLPVAFYMKRPEMQMLYDCISAMPARGDIYWQARPNQGNTVKMSTHTHQQLGKIKTHTHTKPVLRNRDILVWIRIRGSVPGTVPLTNRSGCTVDPAIFVSDIQDGNKKS
jgi:hypothetical protein